MASSNDESNLLANLPRKSGYMYKKGGTVKGQGGRRNWKKRWFVFHQTDYRGKEAFELIYYDAPNGAKKGNVSLFDVEVYCETKSTHKRVKYEFQLLLQNGGIFQLSCDSEQERDEWIASLNMIISYQRKILFTSGYSISGYDPLYEDEDDCYELGEEIGQMCKAVGPGLVGSEAGQKTHFLIQVNDINGDPASEGGMPITATISDDTHLFYIKIIDNHNGTYGGYYSIGRPGIYDLHIKLNDEHNIEGSPFQIEILPSKTAPEFCIAVGENTTSCHPGATSSFIIYAKDIYGNNKQKGGDPFEVSIVGPASLQSLVDNGDGSYICCFEAKSPQDLTYFAPASLLLSITLYGKHICGSPFHPVIITQPSPMNQSGFPSSTNQDEANDFTDQLNSDFQTTMLDDKPEEYPDDPFPVNDSKNSRQPSLAAHANESVSNTNSETPAAADSKPLRLTAKKRNSILTKEISKIEAHTGASMSRLERARQRALMARKLNDTEKLHTLRGFDGKLIIETNSKSNKPFTDTAMSFEDTAGPLDATASSSRGVRRASVMRTDIDPITGLPIDMKKGQNNMASSSTSNNAAGWTVSDSELDKLLRGQPPAVAINSTQSSVNNRSNPPVISDTQSVHSVSSRSSGQPLRLDIDPITGLPLNLKRTVPTGAKSSATNSVTSSRAPSVVNDGSSVTGRHHKTSPAKEDKDKKPSSSAIPLGASMTQSEVEDIAACLLEGLEAQSNGVAEDDRVMWDLTHQALMSSDVLTILLTDIVALKNTFNLMSSAVDGTQVLKLTNHSNSLGAFKLLEEYDVVPTYVTMREVKRAFSIILSVQRNSKSASSLAGGGTGVDFAHFIKFLTMIAVFGLSKTTAFSSLYKTPAAKVDVMLHKWGLADKTRFEVVRASISSK